METGIHLARTILKSTAKSAQRHSVPPTTPVFCCVGFCIRLRTNYGHRLAQKVPLDLESK